MSVFDAAGLNSITTALQTGLSRDQRVSHVFQSQCLPMNFSHSRVHLHSEPRRQDKVIIVRVTFLSHL